MTSEQLDACFPFHLACDAQLEVVHVGPTLAKLVALEGRRLDEAFTCLRPTPHLTLDELVRHQEHPFVLRSIDGGLTLRAQVLPAEQHGVLLLASPAVARLSEMTDLGLTLADLPVHDVTADLLILLESQRNSLAELETLTGALEAKQVELRRALEEAKEASRSKSSFLANVSHEIRTPLNAILGLSEVLWSEEEDRGRRALLETLNRAGQHLTVLVDDLLDMAQIEQGATSVVSAPLTLRTVVREALDFVRPSAETKHLDLSCTIDGALPDRVQGDPRRLRQVLTNLLSNAVKYTARGTVRLELAAPAGRPGRIRFAVHDTGPGIAPEAQQRIFERFVRVDESAAIGGIGLGLTICRGLVEMMGGELSLTSELGRGSTFAFELALPALHGGAESRLFSRAPRSWTQPLRLLIAEDSPHNRIVLREFLRDTPHELVFADDGVEAVARFAAERFDAVLMDVRMPRLDGYGATRQIRRHELERGLRRTPILALTAHAYAESRDQSREAGCDAHLSKPLRRELLLDALEQIGGALARPRPAPRSCRGSGRLAACPVPAEQQPSVCSRLRAFAADYLSSQREAAVEAFAALERGEHQLALTLGHNLKGTGASYGFPELGERGAALERALRTAPSLRAPTEAEALADALARAALP